MKKTNFFKLMLVGAAALAIGFTSCQKGPSQKEFDALCERMTAAETTLGDLKAKLEAGYVKSVSLSGNTLTLTPSTGNPIVVTVGGDTEGGVGQLSIGTNGNWYIGDEDTGQKANAMTPRIAGTGDQKYWEFPVFEGEEVKWIRGASAPAAGYAVKTAGGWSLWLPTKDAMDTLSEIKIAGAASGLGKIDIIGYIVGKGKVNEAISRFASGGDAAQNNVFGEFEVNYAWIQDFKIDDQYKTLTTQATPATVAPVAWKVDDKDVTTWEGMTTVKKNNVINTLAAERKGILIQVHPTTIAVQDIVFELQNSKDGGVLPLKMMDPELITGLLTREAANSGYWFIPWTYEDSDKLYLSKDQGGDANPWFVPSHKGYEAAYEEEAIYSLVTGDVRSEYSYFTIEPYPVISFESAIESVVTGDVATGLSDLSPSDDSQVFRVEVGKDYSLDFLLRAPIPMEAGDVDGTPAVTSDHDYYVTDQVVDYYAFVRDNNQYVDNTFKVTFNKAKGTFKVGNMPDNLTLATFWLRVYKLGVDGVVYVEDIEIFPVRDEVKSVVRTGDYLVVDNDKKGTRFLGDADSKADLTPMFDDLAKIPSTVDDNMKGRWQNTTYGAKYWEIAEVKIGGEVVGDGYKDPHYDNWADDDEPTLAEWLQMFFDGASAAGGNTPNTDVVADGGDGLGDDYAEQESNQNKRPVIAFTAKSSGVTNTATGTNPNLAWIPNEYDATTGLPLWFEAQSPGLYDARFFKFQPAYARAGYDATETTEDGNLPMFDIDAKYEITLKFYDKDQLYLSTAVVEFTPTIPALADFFEKEDIYWNSAKTVLEARYKVPTTTTWGANWYYDADNDGTVDASETPWVVTNWNMGTSAWAGATYYNVFSTENVNGLHRPVAPFDGGFKRFGDASSNGKQWMSDNTALDYQRNSDGEIIQKISNGSTEVTVDNFVAIGKVNPASLTTAQTDLFNPNVSSVVALRNQTAGSGNGAGARAYNTPINMTIVPADYLGAYTWEDEDELAKLNFDMKISSALEQGTIKGLDAGGSIRVQYASTGYNIARITEEDVAGYNYNDVYYSLFPVLTSAAGVDPQTTAYEYRYIKSVEFYIPAGLGTPYYFLELDDAEASGHSQIEGTVGTVIMPVWADAAAPKPVPYVAIEPNNLEQEIDTQIGVRVIDRYGKTKEVEVPLKIVKVN